MTISIHKTDDQLMDSYLNGLAITGLIILIFFRWQELINRQITFLTWAFLILVIGLFTLSFSLPKEYIEWINEKQPPIISFFLFLTFAISLVRGKPLTMEYAQKKKSEDFLTFLNAQHKITTMWCIVFATIFAWGVIAIFIGYQGMFTWLLPTILGVIGIGYTVLSILPSS